MNLKEQLDKVSNTTKHQRKVNESREKVQKFISSLDEEKLKSINFIIKQERFLNKPKNAQELHEACKVLFGFNWPTTACSPENNAPFEWIYDTYFQRYSMTLTMACRGGGKCLRHDTLIPTPNGMVKISDIKVGDYVFGENGEKVEVSYHSGLMLKDKSYKITFDNGSEVITDSEHLWKVVDYKTRRKLARRESCKNKPKNICRVAHNRLDDSTYKLITTEEMLEEGLKVNGEYNFHINLPNAVDYDSKEYTIHPYVMGYWLGDGTNSTGTITIGKEDQDQSLLNLGKYESEITVQPSNGITFRVKNLTSRLKEYGLCGKDKFIPQEYLEGSIEQRTELLKGLMDSDGSISKEGKVIFHTSSELLKDQFSQLASSLGYKVTVGTKQSKFNGKYYKTSYNVSLGKQKNLVPFRLTRKRDKYKLSVKNTKPINYKYVLVSIEEVENDYVCCIKVNSEESMFLCTENFIPTHNTFGQAQTTYLANNYQPNYDIITTAAILNQSNVSKGYLANFYEDSVLSQGFIKSPTATSAVWKTNSKWNIAVGSMRSISGQHPVRLNLDELEFWPWDAIEQTWAVPQDKNGYKKMWSGFSTRQRASSTMNKLVTRAEDGKSGIKLYKWNIFEIMQRCPTCLCIKGGKVVSEPEKKCFLWHDCISYDQYVYTSNRGPVCIQDIEAGKDYVYSWDDGSVKVNKVTDHWKVGEKDVYEIITTNRKSLKTTTNHPFLVIKKKGIDFYTEWVKMEDIKEGDLLVTCKNLLKSSDDFTEFNGVELTDKFIQFIGMYIGDGSIDKDRVTIAEFKDTFVEFIQDFASSEYKATCTLSKTSGVRVNSKKLRDDFSKLGIEQAKSHTKELPNWVYNLSDRQKEILLKGYEISDGTYRIDKRAKNPNLITTYNSTSKNLLRQIRFILVSLGYVNIGKINTVRKSGETLVINGKTVTRKNDLYALEVTKDANSHTGTLYSNHNRLNRVLDKNNYDFRIEKVVSKTYVGKESVYDITVENNHNFIAEGIVVHNCKGSLATKASGWTPREDVEQLKKTMSEEAWATQYLCSKPSTHGLVLYNFEHSFAKSNDLNNGNYIPLTYAPELDLYVAHDPAESKTSFLIFFQIWQGKIIIIDELVDDECYTVDKVKVALEEHIKKKGYKHPKAVIVDPHRSDAGKQWESGEYLGSGKNRRYNVVYPEMKDSGFARIEPGLELVRTLTKNGSGVRNLFVNPNQCPRLVECIKEHYYKMGADNKLLDDATPSKEFKDGIDTVRYASIWCFQMGLVGGHGVTVYTMF